MRHRTAMMPIALYVDLSRGVSLEQVVAIVPPITFLCIAMRVVFLHVIVVASRIPAREVEMFLFYVSNANI